MNDIDKRVVEFEFDNTKFERNVKQSMKTLDELKGSLDFKDTSGNLDKVGIKISAIEIAAITAISRVTNRLIDLGITLVKSLSVDNIYNGWNKFGEKTISVATIAAQSVKVAGKELTNYEEKMEAINKQLDKLNWFTDETSYNFTDMVNNIGLFTAAGQDLDVSVNAMMGIATWAALSGQNASKASHAMYQLSQAMGSGTVQLQDWKSIETAGMATKEFKDIVLETAVSVGELTKQGEEYITKTGKKFKSDNFRESLSGKWFKSSVLTKSLEKYSAAVEKVYEISEETGLTASEVMKRYSTELDSFGLKAFKAAQEARTLGDAINSVKDAVSTGWMNTAEKIIGGYDESKEFWTDLANELYDVFAEGGNFRNDILAIWTELEGRADLFSHGGREQGAFWNIYDSIIALRDTVSSAWNYIFPKSEFQGYSEQINDIANKFKQYTERLKDSTSRLKEQLTEGHRLYDILTGVFSIVKVGVGTVRAIRYSIDPILQVIKELADESLNLITDVGVGLNNTESISELILNTARTINNVLSKIFEIINPRKILRSLVSILKSLNQVINNLIDGLIEGFNSVSTNGEGMISTMDAIGIVTNKVAIIIEKLIELIEKYMIPVFNTSAKIIGKSIGTVAGYAVHIFDYFDLGINKIKTFIKENKAIEKSVEAMSETFEKGKESAKGFTQTIRTLGSSNVGSIDLLNGQMKMQKSSTPDDGEQKEESSFKEKLLNNLIEIYSNLKTLLESLGNLLLAIEKVISGVIKALTAVVNAITSLFIKFSEIDWDGVSKWLGEHYKTLIAIALSSVALLIILKKLYDIWYMINASLKGFGVVLDSFSGFLDKLAIKTLADAILTFAKAIALLIVSIAVLSAVFKNGDDKAIWESIAAVTIIIVLLGTFAILMTKFASTGTQLAKTIKEGEKVTKIITSTGADRTFRSIGSVLRSIGLALLEIAIAAKIINGVKIEVLAGMVVVISAILLTMIAISKISSNAASKVNGVYQNVTNLKMGFFSFLALAVTLKSFANAVEKLSKLSWNIVPTMILIATVFFGIIAALKVISKTSADGKRLGDSLKGLGSFVSSLLWLSLTLKILSTIDPGALWSSVGAVAAILAVLTVFGGVLGIATRETASEDKEIKKAKSNLSKVISSMSGLMTSMIAFALALKIMSTIKPGPMWIAIGAISAILLALTLFAILIEKHSKKSYVEKPNRTHKILFALSSLISSLVMLALTLKIMSTIKMDWNIVGVVAMMTVMFVSIGTMIDIISAMNPNRNVNKIIASLWGVVPLLLALVVSLSVLSLLNPGKLILGTVAISGIFVAMGIMLKSLAKADKHTKKAIRALFSLTGIASVIAAFALAAKIVGLEDIVPLTAVVLLSLISIRRLLKSLSKFEVNENNGKVLKYLWGIVPLLLAFVGAASLLSLVPIDGLIASVISLIAFMITISLVLKELSKFGNNAVKIKDVIMPMISIVLFLGMFIGSFLILQNADLGAMITTAISLGIFMLAISGTMAILSKLKFNQGSVMKTLLGLSAVMTSFSLVALAFSSMNKSKSKQSNQGMKMMKDNTDTSGFDVAGMLAVSVALLVFVGAIVGALTLLQKANVNPSTVAAFGLTLSLFGASIFLITSAFSLLANISWEQIGKGLAVVAGSFVILGVAAVVLKEVTPTITALGTAIALIGAGLLLTSVAMGVFSETLAPMIETMNASMSGIVEAMKTMFQGILQIIADSSSFIFQAVVAIIVSINDAIVNSLDSIIEVTTALIKAVLKVIRNCSPDFILTFCQLITDALKGVRANIGEWTNLIIDIIIEFISVLTDRLPELVEVLTEFLVTFLESTFKSLGSRLGRIISAAIDLLLKFIRELGIQFKKTAMQMGSVMIEFGLNLLAGLWNGIVGGLATLLGKIPLVGDQIEKWMKNTLEIHSPSKMTQRMGVFLMDGLGVGMEKGLNDTKTTVTDTMSDVISSIESSIEEGTDDDLIITPILDLSNVKSGAKDLSSIMSSVNGSSYSVTGNLASNISNGMNKGYNNSQNQNGNITNNNSNDIYNVTFNVTSDDPEEMAKQTDAILQKNRMKLNLAKGGA